MSIVATRGRHAPDLRAGVALCAGLAVIAAGCANRHVSPPPPDERVGQRTTYVIGVTDVLQITVWKNSELSLDVPVRSDGKISVPLLDDVQAEGLTPEELKEVITKSLAEFITAPDVTVIVKQMNSKTISVMGEVAQSGVVPLHRDMRVLDAIAAVGGFSAFADKGDVRVLRRTDQGLVEYQFDYGDYLDGDAPQSNLLLMPGDHIVVPN